MTSSLIYMAAARSVLAIVAQGVVAVLYLALGHSTPWSAAAKWWTVYGTLIDLGCLLAMTLLARREGLTVFDLSGLKTVRWGHDLPLAFGILVVVFFVAFGAWAPIANRLVYDTALPDMYPGLLSARVLPSWAVFYSLGIWWVIWSFTEQTTYQGYALPRLVSRIGVWPGALTVGFFWVFQHCLIPFIPEWRYVGWRFLYFVPVVALMITIYLRTRRLPPLIFAHWPMDFLAAWWTLAK